jgi:cell division protein FtsI/penicillin-binding protein 2
MSDKIKSKVGKVPFKADNKIVISKQDFQYLNSIETLKRSVNYYFQQIQGEYLKIVSVSLGYKPEQDLTFGIDLEGDTRELTVHELTAKEKSDLQPPQQTK